MKALSKTSKFSLGTVSFHQTYHLHSPLLIISENIDEEESESALQTDLLWHFMKDLQRSMI